MNIPLFKVFTDEGDVEAVAKVIRRGEWWANGPEVAEFEEMMADYVGTKYAVAFNSGTSALHAALLSHGVGARDEVIVPSFTFPATANVVLAVGAKPVFAEIEEETYGLDVGSVLDKQTRHTRLVIPVHYGGCLCRDIFDMTTPPVPPIVEDAAEALGASSADCFAGKFGGIGMFSLCAPKVITAGEGGVLVTSNEYLYRELQVIRNHGISSPAQGTRSLGYNWRMSSITAALAMSQLGTIETAISLRRKNSSYLSNSLGMMDSCTGYIKSLPWEPAGFRHIFQMYTIRVPEEHRDPLLRHLNDNGIGAKVYFPCVHLMPLYRKMGWKEGDLPVTEQVSREVITLPMYPDLTEEEMDYMVEMIGEYFGVH